MRYDQTMGRDLVLYPNSAGKAELVSFVESFDNVRAGSHLWDWPTGAVHFFWFDNTDYKSTAGVEITIYPVRDSERKLSRSAWAMHVRNTYSASWHDVEMLNRILRTGRKRFGGDIFGDYGKNRYAPLWDDESTPISRGLAWVYSMSHNNIRAILHALPGELDIPMGDAKLEGVLRSADPSRVTYNGLVPFLVSILEFYFKNIFIIALKYDLDAQDRIRDFQRKAGAVGRIHENGFEASIADSISFTDLRNVKRAYLKWLNIDVRNPLTLPQTRHGESSWHRLGELIKYRHEIIHRMGVDTSFSQKEFIDRAQLVEESLDLLLEIFAEKYQMSFEHIES